MDNQHNDSGPQPIGRGVASGQEEPMVPLQHYWNIVLKRVWTILLAFVVVFTLVAVYTFKQPRIFEARTSIIIDLSTPQVLGKDVQQVVELSAADYWNSDQYFETQYAIIKSRMVAEKVVEKLGLADDLVFLELDHISDEAKLVEELAKIDPVDHLVQMTEVDPALQSRIVSINIRHSNAEMSSRLANAIAEAYKAQNIARSKESTYGAYDWLTTQYQEVKEKLEDSDKALYDFKRKNNILSTSLEDRQNITSQRLIDLNRQLTSVQAQRMHSTAEVNEIRKMRGQRTNAPVQEVIDNPLIQSLRTKHTELRTKEAELSGRYLDKHPDVVAVKKQIGLVEKELNREIRNILLASERELTVLRSSEGQLKGEIGRLKDEALTLNEKELVYTRLEREKETNSRLYDLVLRRLKETDISRLLQNNNIRILDRALVPEIPVMPRVPLNLLIGVILGLATGVVLAFFREMMDNTVKTQEDVEGLLGMTFLGVIPTIKEFRKGPDKGMPLPEGELRDLHVHEFPKSSVAECCRTIRTNILFMSPDKKMSRLLVTSAGPREGKTVTAVNIATVMSQSNSRVLVVDTDMRRPRVHRVFGVENDVGLSNLIIGEVTYEDAIKRTPVPNLDVLLCGPIPPNPAELMHTERFHSILRDLDDRYDWVIFDSPPTIAVTDAMILSNLVDGVLLVVKGAQTTKEFVRRAKDKLVGVNAPILGCILNDVDLENRQYGNYYYYYRRYGQYYEEDSASEPA